MRRRCPTPAKRKFRDRIGAALWAAYSSVHTGDQQESYRCPCGRWHSRSVAKQRSRHA